MDQTQAKKILQELVKREDLKNKICNDCSNPNPQWASIRYTIATVVGDKSIFMDVVSFGVFICLQCAGTHRGFGVHIRYAMPYFIGSAFDNTDSIVSCDQSRWIRGRRTRSSGCRYDPSIITFIHS